MYEKNLKNLQTILFAKIQELNISEVDIYQT